MHSNIKEILQEKAKSTSIYNNIIEKIEYKNPFDFIDTAFFSNYKKNYKSSPSINGRIFELLICETLYQENLLPFYHQATFEKIPNAVFDIVLYNKKSPIVLTVKTSLRERYKQADLEGIALKQVYRKSKVYLITLSDKDSSDTDVKVKIEEGSVTGIDECYLANKEEFECLLKELKKETFIRAKEILPIEGKILYKK